MPRSILAPAFAILAATLPSCPAFCQTQSTTPWTVQEIYGAGANSGGEAPEAVSWAPDGRRVTFLNDKGDLMQIQVPSGKITQLIPESRIDRLLNAPISEQDRDHRGRYDQPDYIWSPDSRQLLFDTNGELWLFNADSGTGTQVGNTGMQSGDDAKFSPDGASISFLRDDNLYVQKPNGSSPLALTNTTGHTLLNGGIDWVYLEELDVRSNYFWSPDSKQIAYLQMDEQHVPEYPIEDWIPLHAKVDYQRYPQPGDPNPGVRVGVVSATGGATHWLNVPLSTGNDYIPRFGWVNPRVVWIETLTRDQKHLNIYFGDTQTGQVKLALAQSEPKYFNLTYGVNFLAGGQFLLLSWRDGHTHIYRYSFDQADPMSSEAKLENQVESGDYEVMSIKAIDEQSRTVYYLSTESGPREQQVWAVQLDGSDKHQVTKEAGVHDPNFGEHGSAFLDTYSTTLTPPSVAFCTGNNGECKQLWHSTPIKNHTLRAPELLTLTAADGKTKLYGTLMLPEHATGAASVPLIVNPYGGPGVGEMKNAWHAKGLFFDLLFAEHGFAVLHVDNRGMAGRGRDFEQVCYHNFGPPELADQLASVDQVLAKYPQLDAHRMGWYGWSWGGTFTLYALSHSDRFLAGMSGAPVTDWRNYDSIYTERYMGLPSEDAKNYQADSVQNSAQNLKGHILLMHGTGDDNVHFSNTIQYIQKLIDAGIVYDYNVFPRKTHSVAGPPAQTERALRLLEQMEMYVKNTQPGSALGAAQ